MRLAKLALFPTLLLLGCEESSGPSEKPDSKGPLVGNWEEVFPDTATTIGREVYKEKTAFGAKWESDTLLFKDDSVVSVRITGVQDKGFRDDRYRINSDTLLLWNPRAGYDTSKTQFEVRNDTLFIGEPNLPYRTPYTRY